MSSKLRKMYAKVLNPKRARRKNFECSRCAMSYNSADYRTLYEVEKIVYFLFPSASRKVYCHDCLFKEVALAIRPTEEGVKLVVENTNGSYTLTIDKEENYE